MDNNRKILLVDHQSDWAERFVNALQVRGWEVPWTTDLEHLYHSDLYSVYLFKSISSEHRAQRDLRLHSALAQRGKCICFS